MLVVVINLFGSGTEPDMQEDNYYIDYTGGTIPLADLPIGARVVDPSWKWEYRLGVSYSNKGWDDDPTPAGEVKPVIWIVVAKNHYDGLEPHVTLLAEELIGLHAFDNSSHVTNWGYNHWGESGTHSSADRGLRPWLNSTGIHSGEGFYRTFSENFKEAILTTNVPNKEWENGTAYNTNDHVFTPSTTELGDSAHNWTYPIGTVYPYFSEENYKKRVALLGGEACFYWTRSPTSYCGSRVSCVTKTRGFSHFSANSGRTGLSSTIYFVGHGVRPALNLKSGTLVSEIGN